MAKGIYIKDEKELEDYIVNNNKELKKIKRGSKEFIKELDLEKSKMNIQRFNPDFDHRLDQVVPSAELSRTAEPMVSPYLWYWKATPYSSWPAGKVLCMSNTAPKFGEEVSAN